MSSEALPILHQPSAFYQPRALWPVCTIKKSKQNFIQPACEAPISNVISLIKTKECWQEPHCLISKGPPKRGQRLPQGGYTSKGVRHRRMSGAMGLLSGWQAAPEWRRLQWRWQGRSPRLQQPPCSSSRSTCSHLHQPPPPSTAATIQQQSGPNILNQFDRQNMDIYVPC